MSIHALSRITSPVAGVLTFRRAPNQLLPRLRPAHLTARSLLLARLLFCLCQFTHLLSCDAAYVLYAAASTRSRVDSAINTLKLASKQAAWYICEPHGHLFSGIILPSLLLFRDSAPTSSCRATSPLNDAATVAEATATIPAVRRKRNSSYTARHTSLNSSLNTQCPHAHASARITVCAGSCATWSFRCFNSRFSAIPCSSRRSSKYAIRGSTRSSSDEDRAGIVGIPYTPYPLATPSARIERGQSFAHGTLVYPHRAETCLH